MSGWAWRRVPRAINTSSDVHRYRVAIPYHSIVLFIYIFSLHKLGVCASARACAASGCRQAPVVAVPTWFLPLLRYFCVSFFNI